jgi:hypothetical protein
MYPIQTRCKFSCVSIVSTCHNLDTALDTAQSQSHQDVKRYRIHSIHKNPN